MDNITPKHLAELAQKAYDKNIVTASGFLNMNEISTLKSLHLPTGYTLWGGYDGAERCIACFGKIPDNYQPPLHCLRIAPLNIKFADNLTHRDFLGALLNLGIERSVLGDILVADNCGYLFCLNSISEYICTSLNRVKHTTVTCTHTESLPKEAFPSPEYSEYNVSSCRADAVTAAVYKLSRKEASELFRQSNVFINARLCEKEDAMLKEGDVVSVRHHGRYVFDGVVGKTKKGRTVIAVRIYR